MTKELEELLRMGEDFDSSPEGYGYQLRLDFAEILWRSLRKFGWTQSRFAKEAGWSDSFVSNLIHASQNCELDTVGKALHTLGLRARLQITSDWSARTKFSFTTSSTDIASTFQESQYGQGKKIQITTSQTPAEGFPSIATDDRTGRSGASYVA